MKENEPPALVDRRVAALSAAAVVLGLASAFVAAAFVRLIALATNLSFYGRLSFSESSPAGHTLGLWVLAVPVAGGVLVGLMARYGSKAIRGHGIPEAMEQVLLNESRIPAKLIFLKPVSAALSIGTGGPFGAEGPIIATGGALGSLLGQLGKTTASERKTLLAAGAAGGMTAIFGSPISAVLLAVELLLFELRPRSIIPVAMAAVAAMGMRGAFFGAEAAFPMAALGEAGGAALAAYVLIGALAGAAAVAITKLVYAVEDAFEELPLHWMWWPALGGLAVGLVGWLEPKTLGVGYSNITGILNGDLAGRAVLMLGLLKFASWSISLSSGTSGGTLAPLFTIGGAFGAVCGELLAAAFPHWGVDPRAAALVGMAAVFAGASRALLTSVVFAFEATRQPLGLLPLLAGCSASYLISCLLMENTIMTEKIARRGVKVPAEYTADYLEQVRVRDVASKAVVTLRAEETLGEVRTWIASGAEGSQHQGFPVLDAKGRLAGVLTRRDLIGSKEAPGRKVGELLSGPALWIFDDASLAEARDRMVEAGVGRLPVVPRSDPSRLSGMLSRSDLLSAHGRRLREARHPQRHIKLRLSSRFRGPTKKG